MGEFLSFIFTAIIIIYLIGFIGRFLFRIWVARKMKEMEGNGGNGGQPFFWSKSWGAAPKPPKEGSVKVTNKAEDAHKVDKTLGEYVEYEEIEAEEAEEMEEKEDK